MSTASQAASCSRAGGYVVARELPAMFDDLTLAEAGTRLTLLQETFAAVGDRLDSAVLRFRDHKIYVKPLSGGALCIITVAGVNMPVLRMAANLVGRRITPVLEPIADDPASLEPASSSDAAAGVTHARRPRQRRGVSADPASIDRPSPSDPRRARRSARLLMGLTFSPGKVA